MFLFLALVGFVVFWLEIVASQRIRAANAQGYVNPKWHLLFRWRYLVGTFFAVLSVFAQYPMTSTTETYRVIGIPFFVAAFDQAGRDYVGPLTPFAFLGNLVVWFFLPSLFLWAWVSNSRRQSSQNG